MVLFWRFGGEDKMTNHIRESIHNLAGGSAAMNLGRYFFGFFNRALLATLVVAAAMSLMLAGCGPMEIRAGKEPNVGALQSLQAGKSTQRDVRALLGNPDGQGRSMFPWQDSPRTLWSYYYEEGVIDMGGSNSDDRRVFLFVFLDGDKYDGYMWFSNLKPSR